MILENGDNREESADHICCGKGYYLCIKMSAQHYLLQSQVLNPKFVSTLTM